LIFEILLKEGRFSNFCRRKVHFRNSAEGRFVFRIQLKEGRFSHFCRRKVDFQNSAERKVVFQISAEGKLIFQNSAEGRLVRLEPEVHMEQIMFLYILGTSFR
jgi:hypothetical protein